MALTSAFAAGLNPTNAPTAGVPCAGQASTFHLLRRLGYHLSYRAGCSRIGCQSALNFDPVSALALAHTRFERRETQCSRALATYLFNSACTPSALGLVRN